MWRAHKSIQVGLKKGKVSHLYFTDDSDLFLKEYNDSFVNDLLCGFFKLPNHIPKPVWKYPLHYVAFHTYANQGMFKNEYEGLRFASNEVGGGYISGEEVLRNTWQVDMSYSKWVDLAILIGMIVVYRVLLLGFRGRGL